MTQRDSQNFFCSLILAALLFSIPTCLFAQANQIKGFQVSPVDDFSSILTIQNQERPDYEIFENLKTKVMIIKIRNSEAKDLKKQIDFDDSLIDGIKIQSISKSEHWLKIKTHHPDLVFKVLPQVKKSNELKIQFTREIKDDEELSGPELVNVLRELDPRYEKLMLFFDRPVQFDIIRDMISANNPVQVRFLNVRVEDDLILPDSPTKIIKSIKLEKKGKYQVMVITPEKYDLIIEKSTKQNPFQITLNITEDRDKIVAKTAKQLKLEQERQEELKKKELEKTQFITDRFAEAERAFKRGSYKRAALLFKNIYNFAPEHELGIRANFRSADALFQLHRASEVAEDHELVLQEYKSAIYSALVADKGYEHMPRAYFNMGRSLLSLKFYEDAFNQFEIISELFPESPFSKDALFQKGVIHLNMFRFEQAIEDLERFVEVSPNAPQLPAAHYKIGEAEFQLRRYKRAKANFDRAWSLDPDYMKSDAELMFHMGEAYYENKDYQTARAIYEILIDLYPNETFSNLVAIRIGDFLRSEDKEDDAIKAYEKAIVQYTKELLLIGKLRIANIYAEKPEKDQYKKAIELYDFIIEKHPLSDQVQEAMLRKSLTLALFQKYPEAVEKMEEFCGKYPENIYVKNGIIQRRILETIKDYIKSYYLKERYLDSLGVFEKYEKKYYLRPQESQCFVRSEELDFGEKVPSLYELAPLFVIADSYYRLGLHDKAITFFDRILNDKDNPYSPLVLFNKGMIKDLQADPDAAQQIYAQFIKDYPAHSFTPLAKKALGDSYYKVHKADRVERAIRIYRQTIRDYQDSENLLDREIIPNCWYALGNLYQEIGQYDNSISAYKNALVSYEHPLQDEEVADFVVDTHFTLGNLFFELNQMPEAMEAYNQSIELFPTSEKTPWAKYQKGQIYIKGNQKDKALKIFEDLIEAAKEYPDALWGPMAQESFNSMVNDLNFDKYLRRTPSAALEGQ